MRILYSHYLANDDHPAAQMVGAVAGELQALGHDVRVHRSHGPAIDAVPGVAVHSKSSGIRGKLWFLRALARNAAMYGRDRAAVTAFQPDIVLCRQDAYCFSMPRAARKAGVPLVTYADAPVAYETRLFPVAGRWHPPGLVEAVEHWGLRHSRAVITVSHPAARRLQRYGCSAPIHVVHNGVTPNLFPPLSATERDRLRRQWGLTRPIALGFLGSFRAFHGMDRLRELMLATAAWPDAQWLLVGDGPERAALQAAVAGRAAAIFLGRRPANELSQLVALMDVAVAPHAQLDGDFYFCPLKLLEYAASGCAIVAGDQGDIPLLLPSGCAVLLRADDDGAAWIAAIRRLVEDPQARGALGRAAQQHAMTRLTWRRTAERVAAVLEDALPTLTAPADLRANAPASSVRELVT